MVNSQIQIRGIPHIGLATLLVVLLLGGALSFCHVCWDVEFSHPGSALANPFWTWDSIVVGLLAGLGVIALGTPVVNDRYRAWFVLRDDSRWPERLRWRVVKQEWFAIVISVLAIAGLTVYCLRTEVFVGSAWFGMLAAICIWMRRAVEPPDGSCTPDNRQSHVEREVPPAVQFNLRRLLALVVLSSIAVTVAQFGMAVHELRRDAHPPESTIVGPGETEGD